MAKKVRKPDRPEPPPAWKVDPVRFAKARKDAGISQLELCWVSGVSVRAISRLETGAHQGSPSLQDVGALADVLGVDVRWLCARPTR